jgi:hypothetical protein
LCCSGCEGREEYIVKRSSGRERSEMGWSDPSEAEGEDSREKMRLRSEWEVFEEVEAMDGVEGFFESVGVMNEKWSMFLRGGNGKGSFSKRREDRRERECEQSGETRTNMCPKSCLRAKWGRSASFQYMCSRGRKIESGNSP